MVKQTQGDVDLEAVLVVLREHAQNMALLISEALDVQGRLYQEAITGQAEVVSSNLALTNAQEEKNAIDRQQAEATRRRAAYVEELLSRVGAITSEFSQLSRLVSDLVSHYPLSDSILELSDELRRANTEIVLTGEAQTDEIRILTEIMRIVAMGTLKKTERDEALELLDLVGQKRPKRWDVATKESLRTRLDSYMGSLNRLEERKAKYGAGHAPVELVNQIEETEAIIRDLSARLSALNEKVS